MHQNNEHASQSPPFRIRRDMHLKRSFRRWMQYATSRLRTACPLCNLPAFGGVCCEPCASDLWLANGQSGLCRQCLASIPLSSDQCQVCETEPADFSMTIAGMAYRFPGDMLIQDFKGLGRLDYGPALASLLARSVRAQLDQRRWPDVLLPVPSSRTALQKRGFNPAGELASQLSRQLGIPVCHTKLLCQAERPAQKTLDLCQRTAQVRGRYACRRLPPSIRVGLVDDVMTTGSTLREISSVLVRQGAASVIALVAARTPMETTLLAKSHHVRCDSCSP